LAHRFQNTLACRKCVLEQIPVLVMDNRAVPRIDGKLTQNDLGELANRAARLVGA